MSNKTKTVEYFVDLYPGWQDWVQKPVIEPRAGFLKTQEGVLRIRILVELPCIGGSAYASETVAATTEEVPETQCHSIDCGYTITGHIHNCSCHAESE